MAKYRFWAIIIIAMAVVAGFFVWNSQNSPDSSRKFKLGLDLSGGTHLVYKADTSQIQSGDISSAMQSLRDVIERRINIFGVSEPIVQVEQGGVFGGAREQRLIVELPGVTNVSEAIKMIGETPVLEFKLLSKEGQDKIKAGGTSQDVFSAPGVFLDTGLTGRMLQKASIQFDQNFANKPIIGLKFNQDGSKLFSKITKENVGDILGIFLDGNLIEAPYIREEITGGQAVITGDFTADQAKQVVRDLNYGALPMPISLLSTETIGATLGDMAVIASVKAGLYAFIVVALFLIAWYRFQGLVAALALIIYTIINLCLFKLIPVTLTAAGIAGFILSIGMAVDANILIFERTKEELKRGKNKYDALKEGFHRAWSSIRDSNLSSIITAVILYYFASTPVIKGFALVFLIGVLVSMFSAVTASRTILFAISRDTTSPPAPLLAKERGGKK
jgi:protein-export membrane protein SecD